MANKKVIIKKAKFGDNIGNWAKGIGRFALGNIPLFGDNIVNAIPALRDFEPENKFAKGLLNFNEKILNPVKDQVAGFALNTVAPGLGMVAGGINKNLDAMQQPKESSAQVSYVNPRYSKAGGKMNNIKYVKGGTLHRLSSTGVYANGNSHKEGGIKLNKEVEVEGGEGIHQIGKNTVVSSDSLQDPNSGRTFAEMMTELEAQKGKLEVLLNDHLKKNGNKTDNTVIVYKKKIKEINDRIKDVYKQQEQMASNLGLRDSNGNPNRLSQEIVETPQNQNMGPTRLSKMGGRLKKYGLGNPKLKNGIPLIEDTFELSPEKAKELENKRNQQAIIDDKIKDFDDFGYIDTYDPNKDPNIIEGTPDIVEKRVKKVMEPIDYSRVFRNTGYKKVNPRYSGNADRFEGISKNTTNNNQTYIQVPNKIQNDADKVEPKYQQNTPPVSNQNNNITNTSITSPQRQQLALNREEWIEELRNRLNGQAPPVNQLSYNKLRRKMQNSPNYAQFGNTGLSNTINSIMGTKDLKIPTITGSTLFPQTQSPLFPQNQNNGISGIISGFKGLPQMPKGINPSTDNGTLDQLNRDRSLMPVPLSPLQRGKQSPMFPGIEPMPLKPFNQRGFNNYDSNVILNSNMGPRQQQPYSNEEVGSGTNTHDDDLSRTDRMGAYRTKKVIKGMTEDGPFERFLRGLSKPPVGGMEIIGQEANEWGESYAATQKEHEDAQRRKREREEDIKNVKDKFNIPYEENINGTIVQHNVPPPNNGSQQSKPKQPTYQVEEDVKAFQQWYNNNLPPGAEPLDVDGKYGPKTKTAYEQSKDQWRNDYHGKPLEPEQQPAQVAETSPGYEAAKASGGQVVIIDGKEAVRTPDGNIVYRDGSSTKFNPSNTSKFGGNLSRLKRFQDGGYTKVGTTTNNRDMYRNNKEGGMYENGNLYGNYILMDDGKGGKINYGVSNTHYKREDIPVIGENTAKTTTTTVIPQQTVPQTIPSIPTPATASRPLPKPVPNKNINNAVNQSVINSIPGVGDILQDKYTVKDGITYKNGQVWHNPGFKHDWDNKGININNPGKVIRTVKDIPLISPGYNFNGKLLQPIPNNRKLPLNPYMLTGKPRSKFYSHGINRQLSPLPNYNFNFNFNSKKSTIDPNTIKTHVMNALNEDNPESLKSLRILQEYGLNNINGLSNNQIKELNEMFKTRLNMQYGGMMNPYQGIGSQDYTQSQINSGLNPYTIKKESKWDKASKFITGLTGSILPMLGGTMGGSASSAMGSSGTNNMTGLGNMFKGLGGSGMFKKGGKVKSYKKYKTGGWIQKVTKSIEKRGTAGKCTPITKPGCTGRARALALTFKKMARNRKHQYGGSIFKMQNGGKVYDQNGYLSSNLSKGNYTAKKIIHGRNGKTPITTNGMAFPIHANGRLLYPNTGDYLFSGNTVVETPIKAAFGLLKQSPLIPQQSLSPTGGAYNDIMNPKPFDLFDNRNSFNSQSNPVVSGSPQTPPQPNPNSPVLPNNPQLPGSNNVSGNVETPEQQAKRLQDERDAKRKENIYRGAELAGIVVPGLGLPVAQYLANKKAEKKYGVPDVVPEGLAEQRNMAQNALSNAQKMTNDNTLSSIATMAEYAKNSGERLSSVVPAAAASAVKIGNELYIQTLGNISNIYNNITQIDKQLQDDKINRDYTTYNQALKNRQENVNQLINGIGGMFENLNKNMATYGPEGTKMADQMILDLLKRMPYLQQNDDWAQMMKKYGYNIDGTKMNAAPNSSATPPVGTNRKYGGNISNLRIKK